MVAAGPITTAPAIRPPTLRWLGTVDYEPTWRAMQAHAMTRAVDGSDEIWCLEHPPVYTLGANAREEHLLAPGTIPVVAVDRGGQVTYHGPGQLIVYPLIDLRRAGLGIRDLVTALEESVIAVAAAFGITARARRDAPGVYVDGAKLASLGLRVKRHVSTHGLAVNVDMDLTPFTGINPCGQPGLAVTDFRTLGVHESTQSIARRLIPELYSRAALGPVPTLDADR